MQEERKNGQSSISYQLLKVTALLCRTWVQPFPYLAERLAGSARAALKNLGFWGQKKPSGQEPEGTVV
ncbi:hypothetical protein IQ270_08035 [Microcoleus sp. LEGE 07076]|uniref:hypothetical protein n=1 Tax=Microcoleus sp. LEGE 07076 TaxID=915322 RepID=UPI00188094D4|nr:hypothetical protein [Microcoleus sp. LEGE 07076]MBE9184670.1 hypothetical protein [Microcoleus sp. LEGE 07076]